MTIVKNLGFNSKFYGTALEITKQKNDMVYLGFRKTPMDVVHVVELFEIEKWWLYSNLEVKRWTKLGRASVEQGNATTKYILGMLQSTFP